MRLILRSSCRTLQRLPWYRWDLVENYGGVEIALSFPESENKSKKKYFQSAEKSQILAILGDSRGINIEEDRKTLAQLPGAEIHFLEEPERKEINDRLWEQTWDILFLPVTE